MAREEGEKAEQWFKELLIEHGHDVEHKNTYYDFLVDGVKVELKSCRITIRTEGHPSYKWRIGEFQFSKKSQRQKLRENNVWVAFVVIEDGEGLLLGFLPYNLLRNQRRVTIHQLRDYDLFSFRRWQEFIYEGGIKWQKKNKY